MDKLPKVFVTSIIDPLVFWARFGYDEKLEAEETLEDMISEYVSQLGDREEFDEDVEVVPNQIILAKSNEHGGRWLRATAVLHSSSRVISEIDVVFTGYGSTELVGWKDIVTSVPDYVCDWTKSAECFRLDGVQSTGNDRWSDEATDYFSRCVLKKRLPCQRIDATGNAAPNRLVIYTSKDGNETVQDCLIRKGFAKRSAEEGIVVTPAEMNGYPSASAVDATGGIPEFDARNLFFRSDSPSSSVKETPTIDFEMEWHRRFVDTLEVNPPTHSDDVYCGRVTPKSLAEEPYSKKVKDIKEEIAQVSKADRQLVRQEGWRVANGGRPRSSRSSNFFRSGSKSSKIIENAADDWRIPKETCAVVPPDVGNSERSTFEPESFRRNLHDHLKQKSTREVILDFLRPILDEDDLTRHRLSLCLATIVHETLQNDALMVRTLDLVESLQFEDEFHECLASAIAQCHMDCVQNVDRKDVPSSRLTSFAELLAQILLRFPEEPRIIECALHITDYWIASKIRNTDELGVRQVYVSCVKNFICVVARHSVTLLKQKLSPVLNAVRDMLFFDLQPRSVKEIWLNVLLYVERKETEMQMRNNSLIASPLRSRNEESTDFRDVIVRTVEPSSSDFAPSSTDSPANRSSVQNISATSSKGNARASPGGQSSSLNANAASLNGSIQDLQPMLQDGNASESAADGTRTRRATKKKGPKTMSLQSFFATPDAPRTRERTPDRVAFREDLFCVMCGAQDGHTTADCPDHKSRFIL